MTRWEKGGEIVMIIMLVGIAAFEGGFIAGILVAAYLLQ
nr:MAG TPA: hypothetical protein [Caudoviricetes sp.]